MPYQYLTNIPLDESRQTYLDALKTHGLKHKTETILTINSLNRISAEAIYARISAPHYNACAMDGIALQARITFGANEIAPVKLKAGDFTWVNTGDPLPDGCDAVVMVEDVVEREGFINLYHDCHPLAAYPPDRRRHQRRGYDHPFIHRTHPGDDRSIIGSRGHPCQCGHTTCHRDHSNRG